MPIGAANTPQQILHGNRRMWFRPIVFCPCDNAAMELLFKALRKEQLHCRNEAQMELSQETFKLIGSFCNTSGRIHLPATPVVSADLIWRVIPSPAHTF